MKDHFWEGTDKLPLSTPPPCEDTEDDKNHEYLSLFDKHTKGEGLLIAPRSILRMRVKKGELPWADLRFESKTQSNQPFNAWC